MLLDGLTTCYGYADFLAETLPLNLPHFNRLVVVTGRDDHETMAVCRLHGVECRATDLFRADGAKFNKGRAIDYGLAYLASSNWVIHWDSDIAFPAQMTRMLRSRPLNPRHIYGADRVNCNSYEEWRRYLLNSQQHRFGYRLDPPPFPLGSRVNRYDYNGYIPLGYFQLWNAGAVNRRYPTTEQDGAEHTDCLHSLQWEADERHLLPDFFLIHLCTGDSHTQGANWHGRTTPRFGPTPPRKPEGIPY